MTDCFHLLLTSGLRSASSAGRNPPFDLPWRRYRSCSRTPELNKNLLDGACLELVKDFLANGVGRNKTKMKDAGRTSLHKSTHIRAMLNRVNERWIDFSSQVGINQPGYFKDFLNGFHPKLHSIWLSDGN